MFEFLWPLAFAALPLPLLARLLPPIAGEASAALRAPFAGRWRELGRTGTGTDSTSLLNRVLLWLIWALLVVALARPQWTDEPIELPNSGRDLMLALDLSGSMQIEDMRIGNTLLSRIEVVKSIAADFTRRRAGDRVGLILFGTRAYVQAPLTFDTRTVTRFIREAQLGFAGEDTAIGDALGLAIKRLRDRPAESRVLILLTDGQDTASTVNPMEAAALAAELGVRVYTIGISRQGGGRSQGDVDEALLAAIAQGTGGRYFRARNPAELQAIYALLDELEPIEQAKTLFRPVRALTWVPLAAALALAMLLLTLRSGPMSWRLVDWRETADAR